MARVVVEMKLRPIFQGEEEQAGLPVEAPPPAAIAARLRVVNTYDVWITEAIGAEWEAAYRLSLQEGSPVVSELRLYPKEKRSRADPGEWSGVLSGLKAKTPRGGITSRLAHRLRPHAHVREGRLILRKLEKEAQARGATSAVRADLEKLGLLRLTLPPQTTGRPRRSDRRVAKAAKAYSDALARHSRAPIRDAATALGISDKQASNLVFAARDRGFLPPTQKGAPRGGLTASGRAALNA